MYLFNYYIFEDWKQIDIPGHNLTGFYVGDAAKDGTTLVMWNIGKLTDFLLNSNFECETKSFELYIDVTNYKFPDTLLVSLPLNFFPKTGLRLEEHKEFINNYIFASRHRRAKSFYKPKDEYDWCGDHKWLVFKVRFNKSYINGKRLHLSSEKSLKELANVSTKIDKNAVKAKWWSIFTAILSIGFGVYGIFIK